MKTYIFLAITALSFGCSSVKSDFSYQKGKDSFWNGHYDEAITHLKKAAELDPTSARTHQQLALTYERMGKLPEAWEHARIAYSLGAHSQSSFDIFTRIFRSLSAQHKFEGVRKPTAIDIVKTLGVADKYLHNDHGDLKALYYGPVCLHIDQGTLTSTEWVNAAR
ncbi:MAG: tetratricopeptide repeat protein [Simkania sp.]|nr:tetratricopeptide repeat protein [Simkania sp.]